MNILVVFTGGTIGSNMKDGYIAPEETQRYRLIEDYRSSAPYPIVYQGIYTNHASESENETLYIDTIEPYRILSENLSGDYVNQLIACLKEHADTHTVYDGIIITHGTDTLQYTAAALGYAFAKTQIPIVLVSSNYILDDDHANGADNFYYAIEFIKCCAIKQASAGVYVSYRNGEDHQLVHRAVRLLPHMPYEDMVYSVGDTTYGEFTTDGFVLYDTASAKKEHRVPSDSPGSETSIPGGLPEDPYATTKLVSPAPILYIRPVPGQAYPTIASHIRAILLDTYHSGTLCTDNAEFTDFIREANSRNIPVFLTGAENRTGYESTRIFCTLGIHVLPKASPIAMYMKLWFLTSHLQDATYDVQQLITDIYTACGCDFC